MILLPGDQIEFTDETKLEAIGSEVSDLLDDMERDHEPMFSDQQVYWDWYEAVPRSKTKTFPFVGGSNLVVPLIQTHSDALSARLWGGLHRYDKLWSLRSLNEQFAERNRAEVESFFNMASRREFDTFFSTNDWIKEYVVGGDSVLAINWSTNREWMLTPGLARELRELRGNGAVAKPQLVTTHRGPRWEHVPRDQIMWFPWGVRVDEAEAVQRQFFLTWSEVAFQAQTNSWLPEQVAEIKGRTGGDNAGFHARRKRRERAGLAPDEAVEPYDFREVHVSWPLLESMGLKDGDVMVRSKGEVVNPNLADSEIPRVPLVVTLHRESRRVVRIVPKPYMIRGWPFVELAFQRRPGGGYAGVAKKLEMIQRSVSVAVNQAFDAVTRANAIWAKTTDARLKSTRLSPDEPIFLSSTMADFELLNAPKSILPDIAIINLLNAFGERLSGANDPLFGREMRSGGHPSPATNYLGQIEESSKMLFPAAAQLARQMGRAGEITASLYQQFDTDPTGRLKRIMGTGDARRVQEWLFPTDESFAGNAEFEVRALVSTLTPETESRRALLVSQVTANYFGQLLRVVPLLGRPDVDPATKATVRDSIKAFTKAHQMFLEASEVDEVEAFLASSADAAGSQSAVLGQFADLLRQAQGRTGGVPVGGNGLPAVGAPAGEGPGAGSII